MSEFVKAIAASEVPVGTCREVAVAGQMIAVYNVEGTFYATTNVCVHRGGPLGQGMLDGRAVMCPWHAWNWDVATGENTANPTLKIAAYEAKLEGGDVMVCLTPKPAAGQ